jgi:curved DNA-binding protein CbpA
MRLAEARGSLDAMRETFMALPAPARVRDPWEVLGIRPDAPLAIAEAAYREATKTAHPDRGGTDEAMAELNAAIEKVRAR